jgi:hypothetical protein
MTHIAMFDAINAIERIYGGIHYRFDSLAGQRVGSRTAEFVFANFMTRRVRWDD